MSEANARFVPTRVQYFGMPVMAYDLWDVSPLYENENVSATQDTNCDCD